MIFAQSQRNSRAAARTIDVLQRLELALWRDESLNGGWIGSGDPDMSTCCN